MLCNQMVANYFPENKTIAIRWWLIISKRTRPLQSDGGLLFPRERDHCIQMVANLCLEYGNKHMVLWCIWRFAIRMWLFISQRTRPLQSGILHWELCYKMVINYLRKYGNIAFRWRLIISQRTGTFQTYGALQSDGS